MKGSNWIPADAFESRVSRNTPGTTRLEPLFVALRTSHQNMIRNWGGGIYQRDTFYDLADENGILVWEGRNTILEFYRCATCCHCGSTYTRARARAYSSALGCSACSLCSPRADMMWACAMYPAGAAFLQSAAKEVQDNVRRLQAHPSIALWAGNNEDETDTDRNSTSDTPAATEVPPHKSYSFHRHTSD